MFITKKRAEDEKREFGKTEYLRGAAATAEAFKKQEEEAARRREELSANLESQRQRLLDDWSALKRAQKELAEARATIFIETLKDVFGDK